MPESLEYARPNVAHREIEFERVGGALIVTIPQSSPARAIIMLSLGGLLGAGLASTLLISLFVGPLRVTSYSAMTLAFLVTTLAVEFTVIRRMWRTARFGRRPIVLTFAPDALVLDSPRDFGDTPRRIPTANVQLLNVVTERAASLAVQVRVLVTDARGQTSGAEFTTRDKEAIARLRAETDDFLAKSVPQRVL